MTFVQILKIVAAVATIATGVFSLVRPQAVRGFTGLNPENPRGITEVRAVLGGLFIALGVAPFVLGLPAFLPGVPAAYRVLGLGYLTIGAVRLVSMFADKSVVQSNLISLAVEVVFGVILVL
jgi:hypothetical protein